MKVSLWMIFKTEESRAGWRYGGLVLPGAAAFSTRIIMMGRFRPAAEELLYQAPCATISDF